MKKPYVHSNYPRKANDDYQTVDPRCVQGLVGTIYISRQERVVDCCAPNGSGIVEELQRLGYISYGVDDAFGDIKAAWVVTNPPYKRPKVDQILERQIERVKKGEIVGFAALMRNNFDFAKSRWDMFTNTLYAGQIHLMFRPYWVEEKKSSPIHNFVWHVWRNDVVFDRSVVIYWKP